MFPLTRAAWFAAALVVVIPAVGRTQTRIALSGETAVPGGTGNYSSLDRFPALSGGQVAFKGFSSGGSQVGVYSWSGGTLRAVADFNTAIPFGPGPFRSFSSPTIRDGTVAFAGAPNPGVPSPGPYAGVYTAPVFGGAVSRVADPTTSVPAGQAGPFTGYGDVPSISGGRVQFFASFPGGAGIYTGTSGGAGVTRVVKTGDPIPGGGFFGGFTVSDISGGTVAFGSGQGATTGLYTAPSTGGATPTVVADVTTPIPGGGSTLFGGFGAPSLAGSVVAFAASRPGFNVPTGIYTASAAGGGVQLVADFNTLVPGGTGNFTGFGFDTPFGRSAPVSVVGDDVVFVGRSTAGPGVYTNATGPLTKVVAVGDTFDGRTVADLGIGKESFDGAFVTFWAGFTNGNSGIYVVPVPEPAGLLAAAAVGVGLLRRVRRQRAGAADSVVTSRP